MKTGIFFHEEFRNKDWPVIGDKFRNFPEVMKPALSLPGVKYFDAQPVAGEVLLLTHSHRYLQDVRRSWYYRGATLAVSACVEARETTAISA